MKKKIAIILFLFTCISGISYSQSSDYAFYQVSSPGTSGDVRYWNKARGEGGRLFVHYTNNGLVINFNNDFTGGTFIGGTGANPIAAFYSRDSLYQFELKGKLKASSILVETGIDVNGKIKANTLDINELIRAKEVKIQIPDWSDFVFAADYKLPSLSEVEKHIKEKQHLPDIPSEKEVIENGISVGEMQAKLLQKIEELTLYVIDLKKENEMQNELIKELQNEKINH